MKANKEHLMVLSEKALSLWDKYHTEYQTILSDYRKLLETKREMGLRLNKINKTTLDDFPVIPFLDIASEEEAIEALFKMEEISLLKLVIQIEGYSDSKVRNDLRAKVFDYKVEIRMAKLRKEFNGKYSMNPERCGCGRKTTNYPTIMFK